MNAGNQPLVYIQKDCATVVAQVTSALKIAGYFVMQSFDLHSAMKAHSDCVCAKDSCSCRMVIILVYTQDGPPATLIFDSDETQTIIYLVYSPTTIAQPVWIGKLTHLLPDTLFPSDSMSSCVDKNDYTRCTHQ
jgi:hypothetical protein